MIIHYQRSGGFAGLMLRATIDTQDLEPEDQVELEALVRKADFFNAELGIPAAQGADRFTYTLTIEDGERMRSVTLPEGALPAKWEPLVTRVNRLARQQRGE